MYKVSRKRIIRSNGGDTETFEVGDEIEPTESELDAFGDNLVKVENDDTSESEESVSDESEEEDSDDSSQSEDTQSESGYSRDYPELSKLTVNEELIGYLQGNEFSEEEKEELHDIESKGEDRITAHQRIDEYA